MESSSSSIMYRDPELEASFSFNLFALHVFSDEDDVNGGDDDEEEEYFEIALEQQPRNYFNNDDDGDDDGSPQELELRISFGHLSRTSTVGASSSSSSSTTTLSCSSSETTCRAVDPQPSMTHKTITVERSLLQFRAVNRLFHSLFSSSPMMMTSSEQVKRTGTSYESNRTTKADGKMTKATSKGGGLMMKFLFKCRSINVRVLVASLMKPYQMKLSSPQVNQRKKKKKNLVMKPFDEWFVQREKTNYNNNCASSSNNNYYGGDSSSIQAAIAHCKRSRGQTSEIRF